MDVAKGSRVVWNKLPWAIGRILRIQNDEAEVKYPPFKSLGWPERTYRVPLNELKIHERTKPW